jgi:hypothetical protein
MLKDLRRRRDALIRAAASMLDLITDQTSQEDARKIEAEHAELLSQVRALDKRIDKVDGNEDKGSGKKKKAPDTKTSVDPEGDRDGGSDEDDENDDEDEDEDD